MKAIITKLLAGAATLVLATAPLAASAQNWNGHDHDGNRGGYVQHGGWDHHGGYVEHGRYIRGGGYYRGGYGGPVYAQPYVNGYFGFAPGGFHGYFWNGGWYHHRRWNGGVWLYF